MANFDMVVLHLEHLIGIRNVARPPHCCSSKAFNQSILQFKRHGKQSPMKISVEGNST